MKTLMRIFLKYQMITSLCYSMTMSLQVNEKKKCVFKLLIYLFLDKEVKFFKFKEISSI